MRRTMCISTNPITMNSPPPPPPLSVSVNKGLHSPDHNCCVSIHKAQLGEGEAGEDPIAQVLQQTGGEPRVEDMQKQADVGAPGGDMADLHERRCVWRFPGFVGGAPLNVPACQDRNYERVLQPCRT